MSADALTLVAQLELDLSKTQIEQLAVLLELLAGDEHAPTAIRGLVRARDEHLADSLVALEVQGLSEARQVVDVGSGAGLPGLPLAVALPRAQVCLIESQRRACDFMERAIRGSGLANTRVVCSRAEEWEAGIDANDVVLARALAAQPVVLEYAAPLLRVGGMLIDWRGRRSDEEESAAATAARALGLERREIRRVVPFPDAQDRHLHVFAKAAPTPPRFPRRAGVARKRPLASATSDREHG
jgi:16S rRNA (guanine527-N7)-methyltransferase